MFTYFVSGFKNALGQKFFVGDAEGTTGKLTFTPRYSFKDATQARQSAELLAGKYPLWSEVFVEQVNLG